ncbi:hypothetical protein L7F22_022912 [Adiantum nelumboides]|nr:hypothetical protein [Adiantum nelumboides]
MAVADFIKLLPDSTLRSHPTCHVVGLLSVLAISTSVALLTLTGKLNFSRENADESLPSTADGEDGGHSGGTVVAASGKDHGVVKKRVHFAEDVREPRGDSRQYRLRFAQNADFEEVAVVGSRRASMPANRLALYRGIRQHRLQHAASFLS